MSGDDIKAAKDAAEMRECLERAVDLFVEYLFAPKPLIEKVLAELDREDSK